jgi:murein DD-endopeptidase MepM/ murein hydrolase activator NlpD
MRRLTAITRWLPIALVLALLASTPAAASGAPPPGYAEARADLLQTGRAVTRLVAGGHAGRLHARFAPAYARQIPKSQVRELLDRTLAAGPIGARRGESVLPLGRDRRAYAADHAWAGTVLAIEVTFDARGRITSLGLRERTPLPPDPGAGRDVGLRLPLAGTWWVYWGGPSELQNYHAVTPGQRHAYDLVKWRRGGTARGDGTSNRDYFAFGRRVLAPADGVVVEALDGVRDNRPLVELENPAAPAGNHVLIALGGERYVLLGHLRQGSVRVQPGQRVRAGQRLGRVGNSGNSSEPHLHVHVQDSPEPLAGIALPIRFGPLVVDGSPVAHAAPVQGEFVAPG